LKEKNIQQQEDYNNQNKVVKEQENKLYWFTIINNIQIAGIVIDVIWYIFKNYR
jgi:hypothetical protein